MSRRRKPNSYNRERDANGIGRITSPAKRLRPLFRISREMTDAGDSAMAKAGPAQIATQGQFERAIFLRGVNTLKAARVVAESGHWEIASACARQLYELVLNMEAIDRAADRERASVTFVAFGLPQKLLFQKAEIDYERDTGRDYRVEHLAQVQAILDSGRFEEFRRKGRGAGDDRWATSWTNKSIWALAKESSSVMRVPQYNNLFRKWSAEAHGAPGALVDNVFGPVGPRWLEETVEQDDAEISSVMQMAMLLFLDLWRLLPHSVPYPAQAASEWVDRLFAWIERDGKVPDEYRYPKRPDGSYVITPPEVELHGD